MVAGKSVALLWEPHPEMKGPAETDEWDSILKKVYECARLCTYRAALTIGSTKYYSEFGSVDVLLIGVDTDLFKPCIDKQEGRAKFGLPQDVEIGFWGGTAHPIRGFDRLIDYSRSNPEIEWVCAWEDEGEVRGLPGSHNYTHIDQKLLSELLGCCDFFLSTGAPASFFMIEWEAMACGLPVRIRDDATNRRDFIPSSNPREDVFDKKWDRKTAKSIWGKYLEKRGITW